MYSSKKVSRKQVETCYNLLAEELNTAIDFNVPDDPSLWLYNLMSCKGTGLQDVFEFTLNKSYSCTCGASWHESEKGIEVTCENRVSGPKCVMDLNLGLEEVARECNSC